MLRITRGISMNVYKQIKKLHIRNISLSIRVLKKEHIDDGPIKFSQSPASKYKAKSSRTGIHHEPRLWYEPYVIMGSITLFLIYFTVLREENDIDEELGRSLYSRIDGLEEFHLKQLLQSAEKEGKDTTDIRQRLEQLKKEQ